MPSLPEILAQQGGYRTGLLGKLHVLPEERFRFDLRWTQADRFGFMGRDYPRMLRYARHFMDDDLSPFFLMVAMPDAHVPFLRQTFGQPSRVMTADDVGIAPGMDRKLPEWDTWYADYHNCIQRADAGVGGLMQLLDELGKREDTLVIFTADHGLQFPRGKLSLYEPGMQIPMIMAGTGVAPRSQGVQTPVTQTDVFATILEAAGIALPAPCRGQSLRTLAEGEDDLERCIFGEITACMPAIYFPQRTVRNSRYKLIRTFKPGTEDRYYRMLKDQFSAPGRMHPPQPPESSSRPPIPADEHLSPAMRQAYETWRLPPEYQLYDLQEDPLETRNRAGDASLTNVLHHLQDQLAQWMKQTDDLLLHEDRLKRFEAECEDYAQRQKHGMRSQQFKWDYVHTSRPSTLDAR